MAVETTSIDTLVVGAGQAGVAMSEHLGKLGVPHLVLERSRIAERWRTGRWDSLVANGPAWHDRFPGLEFDGLDPDAFASKDQVADYFEAYAHKFNAPIRTGVEVKNVVRNTGKPGFVVETSDGTIEANRVVVATGPFQRPVIPPTIATRASFRKARCWWSAPVRRACRSPTNCSARAGRCTCRSGRTIARRARIAAATSAGGSACSVNGTRKSRRPAANT